MVEVWLIQRQQHRPVLPAVDSWPSAVSATAELTKWSFSGQWTATDIIGLSDGQFVGRVRGLVGQRT